MKTRYAVVPAHSCMLAGRSFNRPAPAYAWARQQARASRIPLAICQESFDDHGHLKTFRKLDLILPEGGAA